MSLSPKAAQIVDEWLANFKRHSSTNLADDPNYYLSRPEALVTDSQPQKLLLGTGKQIVLDMLAAFHAAQHEIILVTCFWAKSASQAALSDALRALSSRCVSEGHYIRVRICLSSLSLLQKLTQTASLSGKEYAPLSWESSLGLPNRAALPGLDITIRSIFVRPFSVMHPKFVIIDRATMFLPSCNISWEDWFEGCIELRGGVVEQTLLFWMKFWARDETRLLRPSSISRQSIVERSESPTRPLLGRNSRNIEVAIQPRKAIFKASLSSLGTVPTILLPSPHHRNPSFRPMPWSSAALPPPSPLNIFVITLINAASQSIYIQSPNVNSQPVLSALISALRRGVNVRIVTNTNMMIFEQIATAGKLTECALRKLHRAWIWEAALNRHRPDIEAALPQVGELEMFYYEPAASSTARFGRNTPVKSHLKLTIVDDEVVVLGSGNMDRASWYTSQELGVVFFSQGLAKEILNGVRVGLEGHLRNAAPI